MPASIHATPLPVQRHTAPLLTLLASLLLGTAPVALAQSLLPGQGLPAALAPEQIG